VRHSLGSTETASRNSERQAAVVRRQSHRVSLMYPVTYERRSNGGWQRETALCLNVGAGGMLLLLHKGVRQNALLHVCMHDLNRGSERAAVKIRWMRPGKSWLKDTLLAGVQYRPDLDSGRDADKGVRKSRPQ